jgi:predicted TIM-barrel enzyme
MRHLALLLLLAIGCTRAEKPGDLLRDVASEVRTKPRVEVSVKLDHEEATAADLQLQRSVEDRVERENVGRLVSSGTRAGYLFITVEVEKTADAIEKLRAVLRSEGLLERSSFRVITG